MDRALARHRISQLKRLPSSRTFLRQFHDRLQRDTLDFADIAAILARDPALAAEVLAEGAVGSPGAITTLDVAIQALGESGLRHIVAESLRTADDRSSEADSLEVLRRSALHASVMATAIAKRAADLDQSEASLTALLCNIGKWVLCALDGERFARCHDEIDDDGVETTARELDSFGFHHGEAGKWYAELRGLPQSLADTIWLHHVAPSALSAHCFPTRGIAVARLANVLVASSRQSEVYEQISSEARALAAYLGFDPASLDDISQDAKRELGRLSIDPFGTTDDGLSHDEATDMPAPRNPGDNIAALRQRVHRLETLHRAALSVRPGQTLHTLLRTCGETLRTGLLVAPGVCLVTDRTNRKLLGVTWRTLEDPVAHFAVDLPSDAEDPATRSAPILQAVRELGMGKIEAGWRRHDTRIPTPRDGLIVVPMVHEGYSHGQIIVDASATHFGGSDTDITDLMTYARTLGQIIARSHADERAAERAEEFARSLGSVVHEPKGHSEEPASQAVAQTRSDASQGNRLGRFAGAVARTLDGPLGLISSQAQRMLAKVKDIESHREWDTIVRETRRLNRFRTDLAALAPQSKPHLEPNLINFRVHQFVATMKPRLERRGIRVEELYAEGLPRVMLDARRLEHVFLNLFTLAEDAMDETGGTLTIQTGSTQDRNAVIVQFSHNGQGISATPSGNVFEPFSEHSTSTSAISLAVCRAILEEHCGRITLDRGPEGGDRFTLVLPVATREPATAEVDTPVPEVAPGLQTVLIVDDDEAVREILKQTLQMRGYHVVLAIDGVEAQDVIAQQHLDIIILDLLMPNRDGLAVLRDLSHRPDDAPPVMFMTGNASPQVREKALALGARSFLLKPFELRQLLEELDAVLVPQT